MEHVEYSEIVIKEIFSSLKENGIVYIDVPFIQCFHPDPVDFWRFTKFGLISIFKSFKIREIKESNGYFTTIFQMANFFFKALNIPIIFIPIYTLNNIAAVITEAIFWPVAQKKINLAKKFTQQVYLSAPLNYIIIIEKY